MTDENKPEAPKPSDPPRCASCGMPVHQLASAVGHYGQLGVTYEHQACWQSRTFGGSSG